MTRLTVADLLDQLGFGRPVNDLDDAIRWALVELYVRRIGGDHPRDKSQLPTDGDNDAS